MGPKTILMRRSTPNSALVPDASRLLRRAYGAAKPERLGDFHAHGRHTKATDC